MSLQPVRQNSILSFLNCPLSDLEAELPIPDHFLRSPMDVGVQFSVGLLHRLQPRLQDAIDHRIRDQMKALMLVACIIGAIAGAILCPPLALPLGITLGILGSVSDFTTEDKAALDELFGFKNTKYWGCIFGIPKLAFFLLTRKHTLTCRVKAIESRLKMALRDLGESLKKNKENWIQQLDLDREETIRRLDILTPIVEKVPQVEMVVDELKRQIASMQRFRDDLVERTPKLLQRLEAANILTK